MTPDLKYLLWSVALTFLQVFTVAFGAHQQASAAELAGNREPPIVYTGMAGRAQRAHRNMLESLPLFAALVLIAQVAGKANAMTALGAALFFWGRVAYTVIYLAGIPWVRSAVWMVAMAGLVVIFTQLV